MKQFNSKRTVMLLTLTLVFVVLLVPALIPQTRASTVPFKLEAGWTTASPTIDGVLDNAYLLQGVNRTWFFTTKNQTGFVYFMNNATHLSIFIDAVPDQTGWYASPVWIFLDTNNSRQAVLPPDAILGFNLQGTYITSYPPGMNFSYAISFGASNNSATPHTQVEIQLGLYNMTNEPRPGDTIGFLLGIGTINAATMTEFLPNDDWSSKGGSVTELNASHYAQLVLASPPPGPQPLISIEDLAIIWGFFGAIIGTAVITALLTVYITRKSGMTIKI